MKMVSKLAVAAMLSLGVVAMAAPASAQEQEKPKKEKKAKKGEQQEAGLSVSPEYRKAAAAAENALKAKDWAGAETNLAAAEALIKNEDEKYFAAAMRLQIEAHNASNEGMIKALDILLVSPRTPPANLAYYNFLRGNASFLLKKHADALPYLLKARELGSTEKDLPLLLVQAYANTNQVPQAVAEMNKAIDAEHAAGRKPPEAWYEYAISKVYGSGDRTATAAWLQREIADYPTLKNWRRVIVLYRDSLNANKESLDRKQKLQLFRLMRGTGALADANDYIDYAQAAINSGLPWEAVAAVEEGRTSGKLDKSESQSTALLTSGQARVKNEGSLDTLAASGLKGSGKDAANAGDALLAAGNYAKAVELYDAALSKGGAPNVSEVQLNRGVALFRLNRNDEALTAFGAVQGAPLSDIAGFWTSYLKMPVKPS
jgi:hypothetical protein